MNIWLDDIREAPPGNWLIARNYEEFKYLVDTLRYEITFISFDHDLGEGKSGYDCATYLEGRTHFDHNWPIPEMQVHSMNPVGRKNIERVIHNISKRKG